MKTKTWKLTTRLLALALGATAALTVTEHANAQEILLSGPLAGAPAVRKLRLHRPNLRFSPLGLRQLLPIPKLSSKPAKPCA